MSSKAPTSPPLTLSQVLSDLANSPIETVSPGLGQELASSPRITASDLTVEESTALTAAFIEHSRQLLGRTDEVESLGRALQGIHDRATEISTSLEDSQSSTQ
jgi:hypothetical protein